MSDEKAIPRMTIDLMSANDLSEILEIEEEAFPTPWTKPIFMSALSNPDAQCLSVRINSDQESILVAYIIFWIVVDEVHLHNLAVRKEFRRQNLAFNLLKVMEDIAKQIGIRAQTLEVRETNTPAIKLYEKRGFVVKGRRQNYYTDTKEDALIMWADIK
jgi:[ribosomal protein S18]-alanine N-acetyltransferase